MAASSSKSIKSACTSLTLAEEKDGGLVVGDEEVKGTLKDYIYTLVGRLATKKLIFQVPCYKRHHCLYLEIGKRDVCEGDGS